MGIDHAEGRMGTNGWLGGLCVCLCVCVSVGLSCGTGLFGTRDNNVSRLILSGVAFCWLSFAFFPCLAFFFPFWVGSLMRGRVSLTEGDKLYDILLLMSSFAHSLGLVNEQGWGWGLG